MKHLPLTDIIEWYYDYKGSQYGFLLLNSADDTLARNLKKALASFGITCFKQGKCFKPASNNKNYKVYLSVAKEVGGRPSLVEIKTAIRRTFPNLHYDASSVEVREYFNSLHDAIEDKDKTIAIKVERIHSLEQRSSELEEASERQREEFDKDRQILLAKLNVENISLDKMIKDEYERHRKAEAVLEEQYNSKISGITRHYTSEISNITIQLGKAQSERDRALDDLVRAKEENKVLRDPSNNRGRSGMTESELSQTLSALLPNLSFDEDSIRFMVDEIPERQHLFRHLRQLDDGETIPFKKFESANGWMEVDKHISDGQSPIIRIYYKKDRRSGKCCVFVSCKQYQSLTAKSLKELG